jgi:hypothetical protein
LRRLDAVRFLAQVSPPASLSDLSRAELEALLVEVFGKITALETIVGAQREEIARLKGLKGRPTIKPSGMDKGTEPPKLRKTGKRRFRGKVTPRVGIEDRVVNAEVPQGSRFKGYEPFLVQDLVISARATCYLRERWITPDGRTVLAPLPEGIDGHFGPELRRFVLMQYHQGQSTLPRLAALLRSVGVAISKRQLQRLLTDNSGPFRRGGPSRVARRAGDIAVCLGGRYRRAPCRQERVLHANRQRLVHLVCDQRLEEPVELPRTAARRPCRLRAQRRGLRLHAQARIVRNVDRRPFGAAADMLRRSVRVAGPSRPAWLDQSARHT